jgi:acyl carrier protein
VQVRNKECGVDDRETIRQFLLSNFSVAEGASLVDSASLLEAGIVDSTGVLEIITFLEGRFSIEVADQEMLPDNLDSVDHLVAYLERKRGG